MSAEVVPMTAGMHVDHEAILRTLNLDARNPQTHALLLVCDRYGLDPLLKHMVLIQGRPYVTRDGYLHIAHSTGVLDGIEILDEGDDGDHWWARVAVYRKDMSRPFTYKGRYPKSGGNKQYGPEMAIKCAEVAALRRAFNVTGVGAADEKWDADDGHTVDAPVASNETLGDLIDSLVANRGYPPAYMEAGYPAVSVLREMAAGTRMPMLAQDAHAALEIVNLARDVGTGDAGTREDPGSVPTSPVSGPDLSAGEDAASSPTGADASERVPSSSPDALPPVSDAEAALAAHPCDLCGSTRTKCTTVGGTVRCQDAKGCAKRAEEKAHACAGCGDELSGTVDTVDGRDYHRDCKPW